MGCRLEAGTKPGCHEAFGKVNHLPLVFARRVVHAPRFHALIALMTMTYPYVQIERSD